MLSPEELKIAEYGKAQGKTKEQVAEAISKYRATQVVKAKETPTPTDTVGGDISSAFTSGIDYIKQGQQEALQTNNPIKKTEAGLKMVGGVLQSAFSPLAPVTKYLGKGIDAIADTVSESKGVQKFAMSDAGKTTSRVAEDVANISAGMSVVGGGKGVKAGTKVAGNTVKTGFEKVKSELTPTAEQIAKERQAKITQGLNEQNVRLKSADKAFTKNTINRPTPDGKKVTITPIDTFVKNNIAPVIEKGSIQMGDYKLGTGELGKIKTKVSELDAQIDSRMKGNTTPIPLSEMEFRAFEKVMKNEDFRLSGTVGANVAKLEAKFKDFKNTYGETITAAEVNKMRKNANYDFNPETMDISRIIGDTSRDYVYKASPQAQKLLLEQGELLSAKKYAEAINGTKVTGGRVGNYVMRTVGAGVGSTINQLPVIGPVLGMIGGEFVARGMQQAQFKSLWTELRALLAKEATDGQK